jgi:D-inositol-3-phosphate glycosyltransferase
MSTIFQASDPPAHNPSATVITASAGPPIALLTGGFDPPYVYGLAMEIVAQGFRLDLIGSDALDRPEWHSTSRLCFLNLQGSMGRTGPLGKLARVLRYYVRLLRYTATAEPKIFHILWNGKLLYFDRTMLMLYYRLMGKKLIFTAHNVNAGKRDGNDSWLNRLTLRFQYHRMDQIFVHTEKMKTELLEDFGVAEEKVTVIPFGINNSVPNTELTTAEARRRLGLADGEKTILFFGRIRPYKGLKYLVEAFQKIAGNGGNYRLLVVGEPKGEPKKEVQQYWAEVQEKIARGPARDRIMTRIEFVPDADTELYFKAADVSVIAYTAVFQSGILFLSHSFGLPVVASDVGSLGDDVLEGVNGVLCKPQDAEDLARALEKYFASDLYKNLSQRRQEIRDCANAHHSWGVVGSITHAIYDRLLA